MDLIRSYVKHLFTCLNIINVRLKALTRQLLRSLSFGQKDWSQPSCEGGLYFDCIFAMTGDEALV